MTSAEHTDVKIGISVISDYHKYAFMWDKFGITPVELDKYDPDWVNLMITIASAKNTVENQKARNNK